MKKIFKILLWIIGSVIALILLVILGLYIRLKTFEVVDISPAAYSWDKNMSDEEINLLAKEVVSKMTLEEKIHQMSGEENSLTRLVLGMMFSQKVNPIVYSGYNKNLDIPPVAFSDGPRGITVAKGATCFPVTMARGASWDKELERRVGDVFGRECRAIGANYSGSLCINILRHPSWGRAQETYGEDPWLLGEMGVQLFQGIETHNVMTCAKHFAANNIEYNRHYVNAVIDERTLREVYLPHFEKVVKAGVPTIMSSYNKVNGEYSGHNHHLLEDILREDWGFTGFVTSDWMNGIYDGEKAAKAGMEIEMPIPHYYGKNLISLIEAGKVSEERIEEMVTRIIRTKIEYASRIDPMEYSLDQLGSNEHIELAREVAEKSMVLLKNENKILPLDKTSIKKLAVIGYSSDVENTGDKGSSNVRPEYVITPLQGIKNYVGSEVEVVHYSGSNSDSIKSVAKNADAVIMIAGFDFHDEGEYIIIEEKQIPRSYEEEMVIQKKGKHKFLPFDGKDRLDLHLKERDVKAIKAIAEVNDKMIVSLISGSAIMMEEWQDDAEGILMMWYAGMEGGNALANILFGDVNPSGKLPFTIPADESQLTTFDGFAETVNYEYYHGYTKVNKMGVAPAYPFGFGLSYTDFSFDSLKVEHEILPKDGTLNLSVMVSNSGAMEGEEVIQMYVGFKNSDIDRPVKLLRGFEKTNLKPGESKKINFSLPVKDLAWYNPETNSWEIEEMEYEVYVGPSSDDQDLLTSSFTINNL